MKIMNDNTIAKYGWSASSDGATVHHESLLVVVTRLPTRPKAITLAYMNTTKVILIEGSKNASIETELFLKAMDRTKKSGLYLIVLCTDTPESQIEFFKVLTIKLLQVFST
jgi:hypothetical protein